MYSTVHISRISYCYLARLFVYISKIQCIFSTVRRSQFFCIGCLWTYTSLFLLSQHRNERCQVNLKTIVHQYTYMYFAIKEEFYEFIFIKITVISECCARLCYDVIPLCCQYHNERCKVNLKTIVHNCIHICIFQSSKDSTNLYLLKLQ